MSETPMLAKPVAADDHPPPPPPPPKLTCVTLVLQCSGDAEPFGGAPSCSADVALTSDALFGRDASFPSHHSAVEAAGGGGCIRPTGAALLGASVGDAASFKTEKIATRLTHAQWLVQRLSGKQECADVPLDDGAAAMHNIILNQHRARPSVIADVASLADVFLVVVHRSDEKTVAVSPPIHPPPAPKGSSKRLPAARGLSGSGGLHKSKLDFLTKVLMPLAVSRHIPVVLSFSSNVVADEVRAEVVKGCTEAAQELVVLPSAIEMASVISVMPDIALRSSLAALGGTQKEDGEDGGAYSELVKNLRTHFLAASRHLLQRHLVLLTASADGGNSHYFARLSSSAIAVPKVNHATNIMARRELIFTAEEVASTVAGVASSAAEGSSPLPLLRFDRIYTSVLCALPLRAIGVEYFERHGAMHLRILQGTLRIGGELGGDVLISASSPILTGAAATCRVTTMQSMDDTRQPLTLALPGMHVCVVTAGDAAAGVAANATSNSSTSSASAAKKSSPAAGSARSDMGSAFHSGMMVGMSPSSSSSAAPAPAPHPPHTLQQEQQDVEKVNEKEDLVKQPVLPNPPNLRSFPKVPMILIARTTAPPPAYSSIAVHGHGGGSSKFTIVKIGKMHSDSAPLSEALSSAAAAPSTKMTHWFIAVADTHGHACIDTHTHLVAPFVFSTRSVPTAAAPPPNYFCYAVNPDGPVGPTNGFRLAELRTATNKLDFHCTASELLRGFASINSQEKWVSHANMSQRDQAAHQRKLEDETNQLTSRLNKFAAQLDMMVVVDPQKFFGSKSTVFIDTTKKEQYEGQQKWQQDQWEQKLKEDQERVRFAVLRELLGVVSPAQSMSHLCLVDDSSGGVTWSFNSRFTLLTMLLRLPSVEVSRPSAVNNIPAKKIAEMIAIVAPLVPVKQLAEAHTNKNATEQQKIGRRLFNCNTPANANGGAGGGGDDQWFPLSANVSSVQRSQRPLDSVFDILAACCAPTTTRGPTTTPTTSTAASNSATHQRHQPTPSSAPTKKNKEGRAGAAGGLSFTRLLAKFEVCEETAIAGASATISVGGGASTTTATMKDVFDSALLRIGDGHHLLSIITRCRSSSSSSSDTAGSDDSPVFGIASGLIAQMLSGPLPRYVLFELFLSRHTMPYNPKTNQLTSSGGKKDTESSSVETLAILEEMTLEQLLSYKMGLCERPKSSSTTVPKVPSLRSFVPSLSVENAAMGWLLATGYHIPSPPLSGMSCFFPPVPASGNGSPHSEIASSSTAAANTVKHVLGGITVRNAARMYVLEWCVSRSRSRNRQGDETTGVCGGGVFFPVSVQRTICAFLPMTTTTAASSLARGAPLQEGCIG